MQNENAGAPNCRGWWCVGKDWKMGWIRVGWGYWFKEMWDMWRGRGEWEGVEWGGRWIRGGEFGYTIQDAMNNKTKWHCDMNYLIFTMVKRCYIDSSMLPTVTRRTTFLPFFVVSSSMLTNNILIYWYTYAFNGVVLFQNSKTKYTR